MSNLSFYFFFPFIFISRRLITLQYCSGFCHTLTWNSHGFTCVPHPDPPSRLPPHLIPLGKTSYIEVCDMTLWDSMDCSPPGSSVHRNSPGKNTKVGCHALLLGIFPTQGLNPCLPHHRQILYRQQPGTQKLSFQKKYKLYRSISSVQLLSRLWIFATLWFVTCQASLSITNFQSLLKFISIE